VRAEKSEFSEILPVWREFLWPQRESRIEPVSAIGENGTIDLSWLESRPDFWKLNRENKIIGVVSSLSSTFHGSVRLRGLWVAPEFRGEGLGKLLVESVVDEALSQNIRRVWTMARNSALPFYLSYGFTNPRHIEGYEFGPHVLVERLISL
jgi:GNAT superfamily N-acetyltransferase